MSAIRQRAAATAEGGPLPRASSTGGARRRHVQVRHRPAQALAGGLQDSLFPGPVGVEVAQPGDARSFSGRADRIGQVLKSIARSASTSTPTGPAPVTATATTSPECDTDACSPLLAALGARADSAPWTGPVDGKIGRPDAEVVTGGGTQQRGAEQEPVTVGGQPVTRAGPAPGCRACRAPAPAGCAAGPGRRRIEPGVDP